MRRAVVVLPGRGSYTERSLRTLPAGHPWVEHTDRARAALDLPPVSELDRAEKFSSSLHLRPANVSALIYVAAMLDAAQAREGHRVVAIAGNSMGWYTALAAAGALSFEDGFRLVQEMALIQERHADGGQVVYPLVDDDWRAQPERAEAVERALAGSEGAAFRSIELGGYVVLAGTDAGVKHLLATLPRVELGRTPYPFRLMQHGPYHTPLLAAAAEEARERLADLEFRAPEVALVDGRGVRHSPWTADPDELRTYTLGRQITEPFDLTHSIRVSLREYAPEAVVLPGPGNTLGGVVGQVLVAEGWRGLDSKRAFLAAQEGEAPLVISMRR